MPANDDRFMPQNDSIWHDPSQHGRNTDPTPLGVGRLGFWYYSNLRLAPFSLTEPHFDAADQIESANGTVAHSGD